METIKIPGLLVNTSRIGLGTWAIGGWMWGGSEESEAISTIHAAFDNGINLIDTAPVYGFGCSEELVGKALADGRRGSAIIATKVGLDWGSGKILRNSSPARLRSELEDSLRRLKTDVIDIYQVHWPDDSVPFEETAKTLDAFRHEGKIRTIGVSNFSPNQMERFRKGAPLAAIQAPYNLFERDIEKDVLPYAEKHGLAVLAYGALCRGLLTGKIRQDRVQRRRSAQSGPEIPASQAWVLPRSGRRARPLRARAIWEVGARARRPLATRSRHDCRALGSPLPRSAHTGQRGDGLEARCRSHAGDRRDSRRDDQGQGRSGIYGAAANRRASKLNI